MFTVILIDSYVKELLENHKFLFQPFIKRGDLCFCSLSFPAETLTEACPTIYDLIRGHKDWQAIIINAESICNYKSGYIPDRDNPFDFSGSDKTAEPHESSFPMIRLAQMLAGYPDLPKEYVNAKKYKDPVTFKENIIPISEFTQELKNQLLDEDVVITDCIIEKKPSSELISRHQALCLKYDFSGDRPQKVIFIGTRSRSDERSMSMTSLELRTLSERRKDWLFNHYPDRCRFLVSDFSRVGSASFDRDLLEFWLSVLAFSINDIPEDLLKPNRLYNLSIELVLPYMEEAFHNHIDHLESAEQYLRKLLAENTEYTYDSSVDFFTIQPIGVRSTKNLEIEHQAKDILDNDDEALDRISTEKINDEFKNIINDSSNQRRVIDNGAAQLKREIAISEDGLPEQKLDQYQFDYLQTKIDELEIKVLGSRPKNLFDEEKHKTIIKETARKLQEINVQEADTSSIYKVGAAAAFFTLMGFISYLVDAYELGWKNLLYSLILVLIVVGFSILGGRMALPVHKSNRRKESTQIINDLRNSQQIPAEMTRQNYEEYFTNINTLMHCRAIKASAGIVSDKNAVRRKLLNTQINIVSSVIKRELDYLASYDFKAYTPKPINHIENFYDYTIEPKENNPFFYIVPNSEEGNMKLGQEGIYGNAPYEFVNELELNEEENLEDRAGGR